MIIIDENGIKIGTLTEILERINNETLSIYPNLNLSSDTPTGQIHGIFSRVEADVGEVAVLTYNSFDPDKADGEAFDRLLKLNVLKRQPATQSRVTLTITANASKTLPIGFSVQDTNGNSWELKEQVTVNAGTNYANFYSATWGAIDAPLYSITKPSQVYSEIDSYTNESRVTVGRDEESIEEARIRRNRSTTNTALTLPSAIESSIANIVGVTAAIVINNPTNITDSNGIPAHSVWVIVEGGEEEDIVRVLAQKMTLGTGMKGEIELTYIDNTRPTPQTLYYYIDRPTDIPLYIRVDVIAKNTSDVDTEQIRQNLAKASYSISENATANTLYSYFVTNESNFIASNLQISRDNTNWTEEQVEVAVNEKLIVDISNITVNLL